MSYILDALKRAERERRQGRVSVLDETPAAPTSDAQDRSPWRRLRVPVAALALAALLAGGGWLWGHRSARAPAATPPRTPVVAQTPSASVAKAAPQARLPVAAPAQPQPQPAKIEDASRIGSLDDLVPPPPKPKTPPAPSAASPTSAQASQAAGAAHADAVQNVSPAIIAAVKAAAEQTAAPAPAPPPSPEATAAAPTPPSVNPATSAPAPTASAQNLQLMPDAYRAEFPQFSVNVHAYSDDPARRFVLIDGKQYHEGDSLPQGPRIVAIVPEGIVFDWKGSRVLYALNR